MKKENLGILMFVIGAGLVATAIPNSMNVIDNSSLFYASPNSRKYFYGVGFIFIIVGVFLSGNYQE